MTNLGPDPAGVEHYTDITYEVDDPVALVTLNKPDTLNGFTDRMDVEVRHAIALADRDPQVVGTILTGAGRAFCAGADLNRLSAIADAGKATEAEVHPSLHFDWDPPMPPDFSGRFTWLLGTRKPVIAAINGPIAGMAVPIALCCDIRIMAEDAPLVVAFPQRGLIAEWSSGWLISKIAGTGTALDVLLSSRRITGTEAADLGLVHRAVPTDDVVPAARRYVEDLAERCSPTSLAIIKRQINTHLHAGIGPVEEEAFGLMVESFGRRDMAEGVNSFREKRSPDFRRLGPDDAV